MDFGIYKMNQSRVVLHVIVVKDSTVIVNFKLYSIEYILAYGHAIKNKHM